MDKRYQSHKKFPGSERVSVLLRAGNCQIFSPQTILSPHTKCSSLFRLYLPLFLRCQYVNDIFPLQKEDVHLCVISY